MKKRSIGGVTVAMAMVIGDSRKRSGGDRLAQELGEDRLVVLGEIRRHCRNYGAVGAKVAKSVIGALGRCADRRTVIPRRAAGLMPTHTRTPRGRCRSP